MRKLKVARDLVKAIWPALAGEVWLISRRLPIIPIPESVFPGR